MVTKNNWWKLSVVLLVALCAKVVLAEGRTGGATPRSRATSSASATSVYAPRSDASTRLDAGLGLTMIGGAVGLGLNVSPMFKVVSNLPLYVGADTGLKIFSYGGSIYGFGYSSYSATAVAIPLLASAYYRFPIPGKPNFSPYGGISVGPVIGVSGSISSVTIAAYAKGGASFTIAKGISLNGEIHSGLFASMFYFEPAAVVSFAL